MMRTAAFCRIACLSLCIPVITHAEVPATLSTQGVIAVQGQRFTGEGAFRFALINPATNVYLWVNDGSAVTHPAAPIAPVLTSVVNGVYNVPLGDTSISNMTAFPSNVFMRNQNVAIRVWFDDQKGGGVHPLNPDVAITTAPYTQYAAAATQLNIPGTDVAVVNVGPTGKVGIGTPNPAHQLVVNGTIQSTGLIMSGPVSGPGFDGWDRNESNDVTITTELDGDVSGTVAATEVADDSHIHSLSTLQLAWAGLVAPFAGPVDRVPEGWMLCDGRPVSSTEFPALHAAIETSWGAGIEAPKDDPRTDFNLPDLRGRFLRGVDLTLITQKRDPNRDMRVASNSGGNVGASVGSVQMDATSHPSNQFSTSSDLHNHSGTTAANTGKHAHQMLGETRSGRAPGGGNFLQGAVDSLPYGNVKTGANDKTHVHGFSTNSDTHAHAVTGGGDDETRPINAYVNFIIKY